MVSPDRNLYDPPYDDALLYDSEVEPERPRSRSLIIMLAFVVLAAFAGVVWVAYIQGVQQGQRGVNPPVLTADPGPSRVEPAKVASAEDEGLAPEKSYERLWAGEASGPVPTDVQPAPDADREAPTSQDVVDAPSAMGGPLDPLPVDPRMDATVELTRNAPGADEIAAPATAAPARVIPPQPPASRGREDVTALLPPATAKPVTTPAKPAPSIAAAPKPIAPPAPKPIAPPAPAIVDVPAAAEPVQPPVAATGSFAIQLGSFPSSDLAAAQWSKVKGANQELLGTYSPKIVTAEIPGKGTWHRLRVVGFADKSEAKSICERLSARGQACILAGK
jgi:cell division protein FtsN